MMFIPCVHQDGHKSRWGPVGDPFNDVDWQNKNDVANDKGSYNALNFFRIFKFISRGNDAASKSHKDDYAGQHNNNAGKTNSKSKCNTPCWKIKPIDRCQIAAQDMTLSMKCIKPIFPNQTREGSWSYTWI